MLDFYRKAPTYKNGLKPKNGVKIARLYQFL